MFPENEKICKVIEIKNDELIFDDFWINENDIGRNLVSSSGIKHQIMSVKKIYRNRTEPLVVVDGKPFFMERKHSVVTVQNQQEIKQEDLFYID